MTFPASGKIKVTPEESKVVQVELFNRGYKWVKNGQNILESLPKYIFWYSNGNITCWHANCFEQFEQHPNPEYDISLFELIDGEEDWSEIKKGLLAAFVEPQYAEHLIQQWKQHFKLLRK